MESLDRELVLAVYCLPMVIGTFFSSLANIQIKLHTLQKPEPREKTFLEARRYLIIGICLSIIGALLDLSVAASVPVSIRAGLASLSIPVGVVLAKAILNEHVAKMQAFGVGLAVVGPFVSVMFASHDTSTRVTDDWRSALSSDQFSWFFLATAPIFVLCLYHMKFDPRSLRGGLESLVASSFACSFIASSASATARFLIAAIYRSGWWTEETWTLLSVTIAISVFQIICMSSFLSMHDASVALPMYQVMNSLLLTLTAVILFQESIQSIVGYIGGMTVAFVGLWFVATRAVDGILVDCEEPLIQVVEAEKLTYESF